MTISKGSPYGVPGHPLPEDAVVARTDHEARVALEEARSRRRPWPVLGLLGGDLCRTLGGTGDEKRLHSADAVTYSVDLGQVLVDGRMHLFVAHAVVRTRVWRRTVAAMNAQWLRDWNVAPRAHPNDGVLDVYDASLSWTDLLQVRRRLPNGTHVPHPRIKLRRSTAVQVELAKAASIWIDGEVTGRGRSFSFRVEPDALVVMV